MIEMVFFDAGETILRPYPSFTELFANVCRENGRDVTPDEVSAVREKLAPHLIDLAHEAGADPPALGTSVSAAESRNFWTYLYRRFLTELDIPDDTLADTLFATFSSSASYRLFDDVLDTLDRLLGAGLRLGLISNFETWLQEMLVELEVGHIFEVTIISGVEGMEKPDPGIYRLALERGGVTAGNTVHVGDSEALDVVPARQAGMHTVLLDRVGRYPDPTGPKIASLQELPEVVAAL
ncbi:MAG: HAD-IA family hydrolase [Actinobacteria bacterium]|nr:HAD-IA family hydrolase [Actinomycetota bacterium]